MQLAYVGTWHTLAVGLWHSGTWHVLVFGKVTWPASTLAQIQLVCLGGDRQSMWTLRFFEALGAA